ncbi:MAG: bifunctional molybdenum cofactor biosynthesis protein MoaC/MoaB [Deltaproteobacteria bacterium]|nr:bifunctional molybdenum cofactor biosynthesis protein MoaC/MoaB [Deltaproteobacteria bacterium]
MRNIADKTETLRQATASCTITMTPATIKRLKKNDCPKKDVLIIARTAGTLAAKKTPELIPYCHPVPLDHIDVDFKVEKNSVEVSASVTAIYKTGVEMEALTAVSIAALTIYDMLKPIDKGMEIQGIKLLSKEGGKSSFKQNLPKNFKSAVIVVSDSTYQKKRADTSGKIIRDRLKGFGIKAVQYIILPDDRKKITATLNRLCNEGLDLVITTGGTGLGPRDVTALATKDVITQELPAVINAIQTYGQKRTPYAMLSRGVAGINNKTIIINLPGSSKGASEGVSAIFPGLLHVYKMMRGGGH